MSELVESLHAGHARCRSLMVAERALALEEALRLVESHARFPLAHITLGMVLSASEQPPLARLADGTLCLERAWAAFRAALALGPDEGQTALCVGSMRAAELRLDEAAVEAAAAVARMRAAEPVGELLGARADGALLAEPLPASPMKVTLLSGFLGAGKTTLLRRILTSSHGMRIAVVVNDMAELNVDARLVRQDAADSALAAGLELDGSPLVEMTNGCICCTLREDLVEQLAALGRSGRYEVCLVESTGIGEPLAVAQAFARADARGVSLSLLARLDTMVTVLSAAGFLAELTAGQSLLERRMAAGPTDTRDVATLLVEQLEVADVILINKADLVPEERLRQLEAFARATNRTARILRCVRGEVPLSEVVGTGRFDLLSAAQSAGWVRELMGEHLPESEAYGIVSFAYVSARPFEAGRFWAVVSGDAPPLRAVLRSKGHAWLAQQPQLVLEWQTAGVDTDCRVVGTWAEQAPASPPLLAGEYGERRTELVFIGVGLERAQIERLLNEALATPEELAELERARASDGSLRAPVTGGALAVPPEGIELMLSGAMAALGLSAGDSHAGTDHAPHAHGHAHAHDHASGH